MTTFPKKSVVDTNVPMTANLATQPDADSDVPEVCISRCIEAVNHITKHGGLVLDDNGHIFKEYIDNMSLGNRKHIGNAFLKWVHDNQWNTSKVERIRITEEGHSFREFPAYQGLEHFDNSDRKFVAVAYTHPNKPQILQATDSKWWGWKDALAEVGVIVHFLAPDYVRVKYEEKMGL